MKKPWISDVLKAFVIIACIVWFALIVPGIWIGILDAHLPHKELYTRRWEVLGLENMTGLFFMGFPLGIHVGMLLTQRTLWLRGESSRVLFTVISFACAIVATAFELIGEGRVRDFSLSFRWTYFLMVQALPLLWFVYNLNGGALKILLAHRRHRLSRSG